MPHNRYYIDAPLQKGEHVSLQGDEWHHLAHVLRGRQGDSVELINGKGILAQGRLEEIHKQQGTLLITQILAEEPPPPGVILCLGLSRMNHLEWAVEKATELGATEICLFPGKLSEKDSLSPNQRTRLQALILSATKQCGRLDLPRLCSLPETAPSGSVFLCDPALDAPYLWDSLDKTPLQLPAVFIIGPEKGLHPEEIAFFQTAWKAQRIRLHPHILRTETAPLVALSLIHRYLLSC